MPKKVRHHLHRLLDVRKKQLVAGAQVVQPALAVRGLDETVPRALAVAGEEYRTLFAILRQCFVLVLAEATLLLRGDQRL
jgi:hypothetical protein